jgi:HEAT repeat protein
MTPDARRTIGRRPRPAVAVTFGLIFALGLTAARPDTRPAPQSLDALLVRFPARSAPERDALAAELSALGWRAVADLCSRLVPAGAADDTLARYALDALIAYASRPGAAAEKASLAKALTKGIEKATSSEVKTFLLAELRLVAGQESVQPLKRMLREGRIAGAAAGALETIGGEDAEKSLVGALDGAPPAARIPIVQALGRLRSRRAVSKLLPFAMSRDATLRLAALEALAQSGTPRAAAAFERIPLLAPVTDRIKTAGLFLLYARRLFEHGDRDAPAYICRRVLETYIQPSESQVRCQALSLLAELLGTAVLDDLIAAVDSTDRDFREHALVLASAFPGAEGTARWLAKLAGAPPEVKAEILAFLGRRRDPAALPAVRDGLKDADRDVRIAALTALVPLAGTAALPELLAGLSSGDPDETEAVKNALLSLPSDTIVPAAAEILDRIPPVSQVTLIEILAERRVRDQADRILALTSSASEEVKRAALVALESVVRFEDMPLLIDRMLLSADAAEAAPLQNALVAAARLAPDAERGAGPILAALASVTGVKRLNLIRILPKLGSAPALETVLAETESSDPSVRAVAVYALSVWPTTDALKGLLAVLGRADDRKSRTLALQGLTRLAKDAGLAAADRSALIETVWAAAEEPGEKKLVLQALPYQRTARSLDLAASVLEDPELRELAAEDITAIALPGSGSEGLEGMETALTLKKAVPLLDNDFDRRRAEEYVASLLAREGFVPLFDGKTLAGWKGLVGDPVSRARMTARELAKAQAEADATMRRHWRVIDGCLVFDGQGASLCTARDYADFELFADWKIEPDGDSGIYLRGSPQVQIWDPARWPEGSGGLYNNKVNPSHPLRPADDPVGTWNTFRILMKGERVTVWLNGVLVVDDVVLENYWERDKPIYPSGQIELQAHSTPLTFKNIFIRIID